MLADSNLDWGQGLRSFAELEKRFPPITLFYFGDTDPIHYGVESGCYLVPATGSPRSMTAHRRWQELRRVNPKVDAGPIGPLTCASHSCSLPTSIRSSDKSDGSRGISWPTNSRRSPRSRRPISPSRPRSSTGRGAPTALRPLDALTPVAYTDDGTIAIYHIDGTDLYRHWSPVTRWGLVRSCR